MFLRDIYCNEIETEIETLTKWPILKQYPQKPAQARSWELNQGLPLGWLEPNGLALAGKHNRVWGQESNSGIVLCECINTVSSSGI